MPYKYEAVSDRFEAIVTHMFVQPGRPHVGFSMISRDLPIGSMALAPSQGCG